MRNGGLRRVFLQKKVKAPRTNQMARQSTNKNEGLDFSIKIIFGWMAIDNLNTYF
jgi:hypothetical protein